MIGKLLRHWLYIGLVRFASAATGVKPYYKVNYGIEMLSPQQQLLRIVRRKLDRGRCANCGRLPTPGNGLQFHHLPGTKRLDKGLDGFFRELAGTRMWCDECHKD